MIPVDIMLSASEKEIMRIWDNIFFGMAIYNIKEERIFACNMKFAELLLLDKEQITNKELLRKAYPTASQYIRNIVFPQVMEYGFSSSFKVTGIPRPPGKVALMQAFLITNKDQAVKRCDALLAAQDITFFKETNESLQALQKQKCGFQEFKDSLLSHQLVEHYQLTPTEFKICQLIWDAKDTNVLAKELGVSISTIHTHRRNIRKKLNLKSRESLYSFLVKSININFFEKVPKK